MCKYQCVVALIFVKVSFIARDYKVLLLVMQYRTDTESSRLF